jgi:CrcB protein
MREFLLVGTGGFLGAVVRYGVSLAMQAWTQTFPWATLCINVLGCLLIGALMPMVETRPQLLLFVVPGLLGGFTTFSAFGHETWKLVQDPGPILALIYVLASVGLGLGAVWLGRAAGGWLK